VDPAVGKHRVREYGEESRELSIWGCERLVGEGRDPWEKAGGKEEVQERVSGMKGE